MQPVKCMNAKNEEIQLLLSLYSSHPDVKLTQSH